MADSSSIIWLTSIPLVIIVFVWGLTAARKRWLTLFMWWYQSKIREEMLVLKGAFFKSLSSVISCDPELQSKNAIRILEIGPGAGVNIEFFPKGSHLIVIEKNVHFKKYFDNNLKTMSHIDSVQYHIASGENMNMVPDNSVDVVVMTLVFCAIEDCDQLLKEVKRVLAPGGKFYFIDHIPEFDLKNHALRRKMQHFFSSCIPLWPLFIDGCSLDSDPVPYIKRAGFSSVELELYYSPVPCVIFYLEKPHVKGIATK